MNRLTKILASGATVLGLLFANLAVATPAFADGTGALEGGTATYLAKDLTTNSPYSDGNTAHACDELEYSIRLHNTGFTAVTNINVKVDLPAAASTVNTSTMTATYSSGLTPSVSDTTTVKFTSPQTITYENGTTILYDGNGNKLATKADGVTTSGLSLGALAGSTTEFLNFKAKVDCPTPVTPAYSCDLLKISASADRKVTVTNFQESASNGATYTTAVIGWGDTTSAAPIANPIGLTHTYAKDGTYTVTATPSFTVNGQTVTPPVSDKCTQVVTFSTKPPKVTPPPTHHHTPPTLTPPAQLVNTGAGSVVGLFAAASIVGSLIYRRILRSKLAE
ncbi:MAG TPA: hypothetical protein VG604_04105 [Candidatus Saccharimonadales bacterium]|nr:hypothetical protein [Candidatus Saccharimonadales bacterium]